MTTSVFLEGLSGTGKTSIMVTLAATLGELCLAVPETNPPPAQPHPPRPQPTPEAVTSWYLQQELLRDGLATHLAGRQQPRLAVFDRSYLSVLAYCYATSASTGAPDGYRQALRIFDRDIRPRLRSGATVVAISATVAVSLERRRDKLDREVEHQWYRRDFLEALQWFYSHEAPQLATGPLRLLDTSGVAEDQIHISVLETLDNELIQDLDAGTLRSPLVPRLRPEHLRHPGIRRYYETHGGVRTFGQPLGELVKHHAGPTQFFERHALLVNDAGAVRRLDPAALAATDDGTPQ